MFAISKTMDSASVFAQSVFSACVFAQSVISACVFEKLNYTEVKC